ncbi:MAG: hypothetical protein V2B18_01225 [Pseudomonadota bacterium]
MKLYRNQPADLIITDIFMPEKEGRPAKARAWFYSLTRWKLRKSSTVA